MSDFFAEQPAGAPGGGGPAVDPRPRRRAARGRPRPLLLTIIVVGVVVIGFSLFAGIWTDKLWFSSLGYASVFSTLIWTRVLLFPAFGGLMALVVGLNLFLAYRLRPMFRPHSPEQANLERYREVVTPMRRSLLLGVSAGLRRSSPASRPPASGAPSCCGATARTSARPTPTSAATSASTSSTCRGCTSSSTSR